MRLAQEHWVALGTKTPTVEGTDELLMYAFYSYPVNDGMTITPLIYVMVVIINDETGNG